MAAERLPETVQTLYAELLDQLVVAAARAVGPASGSFVRKTVKERAYWYLQRQEGERRRQLYLGPESPSLLAWMEDVRHARAETAPDAARRSELCAMLAAGGAARASAAVTRVLELLADSGVFRLGGVLVGTQAFAVHGNMLGVRFEHRSLSTQDVDIAHDPEIAVALSEDSEPADVEAALTGGEPKFLPVPGLQRGSPSASFKIRGRELRVDFLTPLLGRPSEGPVFLRALGVAAQPLRFLDYLIEGAQQAAVVGGSGVLVNVPDPGRFALHKLWTASRRPAAEQVKALKDQRQAGQLLEVLLDDRPGDVTAAWRALAASPSAERRVRGALDRLPEKLRHRLTTTV